MNSMEERNGKRNERKIISLVFACICSFVWLLGMDHAHAAVLKPGKVIGVSLKRIVLRYVLIKT